MSETVSTTSQTRSRLLKGGGAILGVAAIGAAVTLTASQWTDQATVEGDVAVGSFAISIDGTDLTFANEFVPNKPQTSSHTLSNDSDYDAEMVLETELGEEFPTEAIEFTVTVGEEDIDADSGPVLSAGADDVPVEITAVLVDTEAEIQGDTYNDLTFTFTGTQVIEQDEAENGDGN